MIRDLAVDLAARRGIRLSNISLIDGRQAGCLDADVLDLATDDHIVSALVYQSDIFELRQKFSCVRLEERIGGALTRLESLST
jgi:hypothetical protein